MVERICPKSSRFIKERRDLKSCRKVKEPCLQFFLTENPRYQMDGENNYSNGERYL